MRTAPLPQGLLGRRRVWRAWRAGAELRTENVETCETPRARAPAAARAARPGPAGPKTRSPGILPAGRSPSQPSGSLSSDPCFSPQALWGRRRSFPAASRSSASPRLLLGAGVLSQRRLSKPPSPRGTTLSSFTDDPPQGDALPRPPSALFCPLSNRGPQQSAGPAPAFLDSLPAPESVSD